MSSTNKTANLSLNQWVLTDPFLMEDMNSDHRKIDTAVGAIPYVKLMDVTTSSAVQQVDLNVSGIDFSKYAMIQVFADPYPLPVNTSYSLYVRINNGGGEFTQTMYNYSNSSSNITQTYVALADAPMTGTPSIRLDISGFMRTPQSASGPILVRSLCTSYGRSYNMRTGYCYKYLSALTDFKSINFLTDGTSGVALAAGSRFVVYGVKL